MLVRAPSALLSDTALAEPSTPSMRRSGEGKRGGEGERKIHPVEEEEEDEEGKVTPFFTRAYSERKKGERSALTHTLVLYASM